MSKPQIQLVPWFVQGIQEIIEKAEEIQMRVDSSQRIYFADMDEKEKQLAEMPWGPVEKIHETLEKARKIQNAK